MARLLLCISKKRRMKPLHKNGGIHHCVHTITNNSQSNYSFPVYNFSLEKYNSGNWITVQIKEDYVFMTLDRVLQPNEEATRTLDLEKIFDLPLEKGIYRFTILILETVLVGLD